MSTKEKILAMARKRAQLRTSELVETLKISRQSVAAQLKALVEEGLLVRKGSTRSANYHLAGRSKTASPPTPLLLIKKLKDLEEDKVLKEIDLKLELKERLNKNAQSIFSYAFTEMLNNAIDHSKSTSVSIKVHEERGDISFEVRDFGVGIFQKVKKKFGLENEFEALEHVLKGKQTTAPEAHSGEGIFFTSRIADLFVLRSHKLQAKIDNRIPDIFVANEKNIGGTGVFFLISKNTKKRLDRLFAKHTNENFTFDHADQKIKIATFGGALSRSQAKRLLSGLDKFNRLTLDFSGVREIGQGFADEVFRVYLKMNRGKTIDYVNANDAVEFMIRRAQRAS